MDKKSIDETDWFTNLLNYQKLVCNLVRPDDVDTGHHTSKTTSLFILCELRLERRMAGETLFYNPNFP